MAHYFELDTERFTRFFLDKGFYATTPYSEIVFVRKHDHNPHLLIKVFSSIAKSGVRECGGDAIRIVGIFDDGKKNFPLFKGVRVYRTTSQESIEERTLIQMRLCYRRLNEFNAKRVAPVQNVFGILQNDRAK
jgi:hypothetical protein